MSGQETTITSRERNNVDVFEQAVGCVYLASYAFSPLQQRLSIARQRLLESIRRAHGLPTRPPSYFVHSLQHQRNSVLYRANSLVTVLFLSTRTHRTTHQQHTNAAHIAVH